MNKLITVILLLQLSVLAEAQYQTQSNEKGAGFYLNSIFAGDYADPSILRDGGKRIGLCAIGEGKVTFKNFKFTPIN